MNFYSHETYGERAAGVYDEWYSDYDPGAIDTLADLAGGGKVLELGIGTGRIALPLSARGIEVHGIDAAASMISRLRSKPRSEQIPVTQGNGTTHLVFDPIRRKLLSERSEEFDEIDFLELSPASQKLYEQTRSRFPSFPPEVLKDALLDPATLVVPGKGIVLQKGYAGHDNNVWFVDFQNRSVNVVVKLPETSPRAFHGGVSFNSAIILLLSAGARSYLVLYKGGKSKFLGEFNASPYRGIEVKHVSLGRIIFLIRTHAPYEQGDNPVFIFDGEKLLRVRDYGPLHDAGVDPLGRRIAFCYWKDDKRHIAVTQIN